MKRISVIVFLVLVILCATAFADNNVDPDQWPGVAALGLSNDVMMSIYNDYETAWLTYPDAIDEAMKYEEQVSKNIAEKYGITAEQADLVYGYVIMNYEKAANDGIERNQTYTLRFGDLLSVNNSAGSTAVIKAKIRPSMTNDFREDLSALRGKEIGHRIGRTNPSQTILTRQEFISQLKRLMGRSSHRTQGDVSLCR